jgi:NAD-dependent DNA ligase
VANQNDIDSIFNALMVGNASVITVENRSIINQTALELYEIQELTSQQVEMLRKIIMICNVLYNRTDMTVLPVEDGFYDLLLEKYKKYDSNFQVGSAVVNFKNSIQNDINNPQEISTSPIIFVKVPERDEFHQMVSDKIMRKGMPRLNQYDFYESPISFTQEKITKRSHNTQHNHPLLVGTLDKAKFVTNKDAIDAGVFDDNNVKVLERDFFQNHISKGIFRPDRVLGIVCELKYDGISVEADCGLTLSSARTRGDTGIGQASDITPMLKDYVFKQARCMIGQPDVGVKFEAIMTKTNLEKFNELRQTKYANCRTAIVGLFGASDAYLYKDLITLVPLALDLDEFPHPINNRIEEIEFLNKVFVSHGEPLRYCYFQGTVPELLYYIKVFWDEAKLARDYLNFMYDGIVVSYVDNDIREALGRENFINKYSMAVKFEPLEKQTIFRGYTYEVGQHGNITPMIHYDPVEFFGTIHTKSTGSSLNRFTELGLKYGDIINVKYVNDVMPYVSRLECQHNRDNPEPICQIITQCPICGTNLVVSSSGKSLLCPNIHCQGRSLQRMTNMFAKMNIKGFADASFSALGCTHLFEIFNISKDKYVDMLGSANGIKFFEELNKLKTEGIRDFIILGALGFSSIAHKKWEGILKYLTLGELEQLYLNCGKDSDYFYRRISQIPNIGPVTARTIADEWEFFEPDILFILNNVKLIETKGRSSHNKGQIRISGFRNPQLLEQLITAGFDAGDGSVTKATDILIIPYEGYSSGKVTKALNNPSTKIITINDFIENSELLVGFKLNL